MLTTNPATGGPGIDPRWTRSDKEGVGAAYSALSRVWFTVSKGVLNEVCYPTINRPQIRGLQYLISDGGTFFRAERQLDNTHEYLAPGALGYRIKVRQANEGNRLMSTDSQSNERLRPHPATRFAPSQVEIDLNAMEARLRSELQAGEGGRRQETLYKDGTLTIALFLFERFTGLSEHQAAGTVNMHVLRGQLKITAEGQVHELRAGQMLLLAPGLKHAVAAKEESVMLLTVRLAEPSVPPPCGTDEGNEPLSGHTHETARHR